MLAQSKYSKIEKLRLVLRLAVPRNTTHSPGRVRGGHGEGKEGGDVIASEV